MVEVACQPRLVTTVRKGGGFEVQAHPWNHAPWSSLVPRWRTMVERGTCAEPFFAPEWFDAFAATLAPQGEKLLFVAYSGGEPRGILPLVESQRFFGRIPARTLQSLSNVHSSRFDLIHGVGDRDAVAKSVWAGLKARSGWDVIEAFDVPAHGSFRYLMELAAQDGYPVCMWPTRRMPRLALSRAGGDPFRNCPEQFKGSRARLRGKLKKISQEGVVRFVVSTGGSDTLMPQFLALERSGWKGKNGSAIACNDRLVSFYTRIARGAEENGTLRFYTMLLDGRPIAMHFGLLSNSIYYIPKVAYDEGYRKVSPGLLLTKYVIEDLTEQGAGIFDFLGPRMEWKCVWTSEVLEHAHCYIFRPSVTGRALHTIASHIAPRVRALKHRWFGNPQEWEGQPQGASLGRRLGNFCRRDTRSTQ